VLEDKLNRLETKVDKLIDSMTKVSEKQTSSTLSSNKLVIGAAATVIAGLLSTVVLLLLNLQVAGVPLVGG
jgi:hypothetical protein